MMLDVVEGFDYVDRVKQEAHSMEGYHRYLILTTE